ncbi:MAG: C45 family peptidase [Phycisphaerales bacterium]
MPGTPEESGYIHGRALRDLVAPAFLAAYTEALGSAIGFGPDSLRTQGLAWLDQLPDHFVAEIRGMADGARVPLGSMVDLLFADIARPERSGVPDGPMCSAVTTRLEDQKRWVGRNCDWLTPTLMRGVSAVVHEAPHRIPIMAVGIRGDIDVDTGLNAEGLWMHLHTLHATDAVPDGRPSISWLFWAREALETCGDLDALEAFIERTARDRGVFVVAAEGRTGRSAVFECSRASYRRHEAGEDVPLCVTNHALDRPHRAMAPTSPNASGTISRRQALQRLVDADRPTRGPDDLIASLAAPGVEMRTPTWLRTIYSAVADTRAQTVWFASGTPEGQPAASTGRWDAVSPPWVGRRAVVR